METKFSIGDTVFFKDTYHKPNHGKIIRIVVDKNQKITYDVEQPTLDVINIIENQLTRIPPMFHRKLVNNDSHYYYISETGDINLEYQDNHFLHPKRFETYNYFITHEEAKYVRDNMNATKLRAIWQWKYHNDREQGTEVLDTPKTYNGNMVPMPKFTSPKRAKKCLQYLNKEGFFDE